jgi:ribosomal protein S18 acetylase RimI-like enzyme
MTRYPDIRIAGYPDDHNLILRDNVAIAIREATKRDLDAVAALWRQLMDFHAVLDPAFTLHKNAEKDFRKFCVRCIKDRNILTILAGDGGRAVGYCCAMLEPSARMFVPRTYGTIADLVVDGGSRRRGIGRMLVNAARIWLVARGVVKINVRAACANAGAMAFWRAMGMREFIVTMTQSVPPVVDEA